MGSGQSFRTSCCSTSPPSIRRRASWIPQCVYLFVCLFAISWSGSQGKDCKNCETLMSAAPVDFPQSSSHAWSCTICLKNITCISCFLQVCKWEDPVSCCLWLSFPRCPVPSFHCTLSSVMGLRKVINV